MEAEKHLETPKGRGQTRSPSAELLARQESPYHTRGKLIKAFPLPERCRGCDLNMPEKGPTKASSDSRLSVRSGVKELKRAHRPWRVALVFLALLACRLKGGEAGIRVTL